MVDYRHTGDGKNHDWELSTKKHNFEHIDMELLIRILDSASNRFPHVWQSVVNKVVKAKNEDTDLVITWGFNPIPACMNMVQKLRDLGVTLIWFDGNRQVPRKAFLKRKTVSEKCFDIQYWRKHSHDIPES